MSYAAKVISLRGDKLARPDDACYIRGMKFTRAMLAFAAVPVLWAVLAFVFGRKLAQGQDFVVLIAMSFAAGLVWLAFVNMCVGVLRRKQPPTAPLYISTAVIGSGGSALVASLIQFHSLAAAIELGFGIAMLALISSALFVVVAGMSWKKP